MQRFLIIQRFIRKCPIIDFDREQVLSSIGMQLVDKIYPRLQRRYAGAHSRTHSRVKRVPTTFQPSRDPSTGWHPGTCGMAPPISTGITARMKRVQEHTLHA